ncbi:hypothetical protein [Tritonibacter mobilis]|uniref:hypothetical protein n=1 Tax=Tritonibacter mobilis TaxID=379347 RepID=UPI000A49B180|nr:hypothetical protein [Tritonibacter mobilis]
MVALTPEGVLYGNPPRSAHAPERDDFLAWMRATESLAGSGSLTSFNETLAVLQARPAVAEGKFALVISDAEEAGVYERVAGDWQKVAGLPAIFTESLAAVRAEAARDLAQAYAAAANASRQEAAEIVGFDPTLYLRKTGGTLTGDLSFGANGLGVGEVTGTYGSIQSKGTKGGWSGFSAAGKAVLMARDDDENFGIYDDGNDKWVIRCTENGPARLHYDGVTKLETRSNGALVHGELLSNDAIGANRAVGNWLATKAEAEAGINGDQIMTPLRTAECIAANQAVRARVNFDGTGTPTIRDAHNVTSITDNSQGNYTVNFATPIPTADYSIFASGGMGASSARLFFVDQDARSASSNRILVTDTVGNATDVSYISVIVVG